jgi:hypothetical protein
LRYETSSLGSGTITTFLKVETLGDKRVELYQNELKITVYIPAVLAADTPRGASSKTKQLQGSTSS